MKILDLPEDVLKNLIFEHLENECSKYKYSEETFSFKWNENKENIIYTDINLVVYGNSCWEDSSEVRKKTISSNFDDDLIGEFFDSFLIDSGTVSENFTKDFRNKKCSPDFEYYFNNHIAYYYYNKFTNENFEKIEKDVYYNYNSVRTFTIDIKEILEYLKSMPFQKEIEDISYVFNNIPNKKLEAIVSNLQTDKELETNSKITVKKKM